MKTTKPNNFVSLVRLPPRPRSGNPTWRRLLTGAGLALGLTASSAAPLQPADVPREVAWVLHWDLDGFRQTTLGRHILTELEQEQHRKKLEAFRAMFRFDPRTDLHGLTLYSVGQAQEDGVLLAYADVDAAQLTALAQGAKDHQTLQHRNHTIHHWIDEKRPPRDGVPARTYAAIYQSRVVIFGQRPDRVGEALDVLDRQQPSLLMNPRMAGAIPQGAFLVGLARQGAMPGQDPQAAVLRQSRLTQLALSESENHIQGRLALETDNEEIATQVENIVRGLIGLLALQQDRPDAQWLARALEVERNGATVTLRLKLPVSEILNRLRTAAGNRASAGALN